MSETHALPEAKRQAVLASIKAREDGIRAQAIGKGRLLERADIMKELGVQRLEEAGQVAQLRAERDARITIEEERKHGKAEYWRGFTIGGMVCGAIVGTALALYAAAIINPAFDAAGRIRAQSDITDALVRSQNEPSAEPYTNPGQDVTRRP